MYRIGFTGTSKGMTTEQANTLEKILKANIPDHGAIEFHHGDCIGADFQAHSIFHDLVGERTNATIVIHPPEDNKKRAYAHTKYNRMYNPVTVWMPKDYMDRNADIVAACDVLIACPKELVEVRRSGTWSTVRKAQKIHKPVITIYNTGEIET